MKTLKALCGLALLPLAAPLVWAPLSLSRNPASRQLCRDFWPSVGRDLRTVWDSREFWAHLFMAVIVLILALSVIVHALEREWWTAAFNLAVSIFLATRE